MAWLMKDRQTTLSEILTSRVISTSALISASSRGPLDPLAMNPEVQEPVLPPRTTVA